MRLFRLYTLYADFARAWADDHPQLASQTFDQQMHAFADAWYHWFGAWTQPLAAFGYDIIEPPANLKPLQLAWAREHDLDYQPQRWLTDIAAAQIRHAKPDILFVSDYTTFSADFLRQLRQQTPSLRLILGWCGAPFRDDSVFAAYDMILSNVQPLIDAFHNMGLPARKMHHAFDPRVLDAHRRAAPATPASPMFDLSFVGSVVNRPRFHQRRLEVLQALIDHCSPAMFATLYPPRNPPADERMPIDDRLHAVAQPPVFGLPMYDILSRSRITLNVHIDLAANHASNMRLFEATGMGACLLTDAQDDLAELFEPDAQVVTFDSAEEALQKTRNLLDDDRLRQRIAAAGQSRTLRDHTFHQRAPVLDQVIRQAIRM